MRIVPITITNANDLVEIWHRHSKRLDMLTMFALGLADEEKHMYVGAVLVGRPISATNCDGYTVELKRLVVDEKYKNACSQLYGAAWRAAKALGYERMITYTLETESGSSLKASGWKFDGLTDGHSLHTKSWKDLTIEMQGGKSSRLTPYTSVKRRWVIETNDYKRLKDDKRPYYLPFDPGDLIHRSAPLVYPPSEGGIVPLVCEQCGTTKSLDEGGF